jgi:hypothetical protein
MSVRSGFAVGAAVLLLGWVANAVSQEAAPSGPQDAKLDLEVTLEHVSGKVDHYGAEVVRLELILDATGRLDQVHMINRTGADADTHIWYNVANLVSVRYRFLEITGKGKVAVRTIAPPPVKEPLPIPRRRLDPLDPDDYR